MTTDQAQVLYRQAQDCQQRGDAATAIDQYRAALAADPTLREAAANLAALANQHYNLGCQLQQQGQGDAAIASYRLALAANPRDHEAQFNVATILEAARRTDEAIAAYRAALAIDPEYRKAHVNLVRLLQRSGAAREAAALIRSNYRDFALNATRPAAREFDMEAIGDDAAEQILNGLAHHGVLVLRRLHGDETIAWLRTILDRVDARHDRDIFPLHDIVDAGEMARLAPPSLAAIIERLSLSRQPSPTSFVRRVVPTTSDTHVRYHQDSQAFAVRCLNIWVPLTDCGIDAPGLEVVARRTPTLLPTVATDDNSLGRAHAEIEPETIAALYQPNEIWAPRFAVGDVAVQLGTTIHRSHLTPHMTQRRVSIEIRFTE